MSRPIAYPYTDYYHSDIDEMWHVVTHYGPGKSGVYTCKTLVKTKSEREARAYIKTALGEKPRKREKT